MSVADAITSELGEGGFADLAMKVRFAGFSEEAWLKPGPRILICDDGGRFRERKPKRGNYFVDHCRFQCGAFKENGLPTGGGTVESVIRSVINLRVKGAGMFWKRDKRFEDDLPAVDGSYRETENCFW